MGSWDATSLRCDDGHEFGSSEVSSCLTCLDAFEDVASDAPFSFVFLPLGSEFSSVFVPDSRGKSSFLLFKVSFIDLCSTNVNRNIASSFFKWVRSFKSEPSSSLSSANVFFFVCLLLEVVRDSLEADILDLNRSDG